MKRFLTLVIVVILSTSFVLCGCGGVNSDEPTDGKITLDLWHTWGTQNAAYLNAIVNDFNNSQDTYEVVPVYQTGAAVIRQKMATLKVENYPAIFCGQPTSTCYYDNVSYLKPLQDFLDADSDDWTAEIYPTIKRSYSNLDGKMLGAPFGVSCNGYFVNVEAIRQAGYSVEDLTSFEKIAEVAKAVVNKGVCQYGISFYGTGVELLDMLTMQGQAVVDQDNGYSGSATRSLLDEGETNAALKKALQIYASLYQNKVAYSFGANSSAETMPSFYNGNLAICNTTNSAASYIIGNNLAFEWTFIPAVGIDDNAKYTEWTFTEGTGFYIANSGNEKKMQGAYEFVKFAAEAENQTYWCKKMGYIPYTDEAATAQAYLDWANETVPSLIAVRERIESCPAELHGPYTIVPDEILSGCEKMLSHIAVDPTSDVDTYIDMANEIINEGIEIWALRQK